MSGRERTQSKTYIDVDVDLYASVPVSFNRALRESVRTARARDKEINPEVSTHPYNDNPGMRSADSSVIQVARSYS